MSSTVVRSWLLDVISLFKWCCTDRIDPSVLAHARSMHFLVALCEVSNYSHAKVLELPIC